MSIASKNHRMFDTVTETEFGPVCLSNREVWELARHIQRTTGKDPRDTTPTQRILALSEIRSNIADSVPTHATMLCDCGSGKQYLIRVWSESKSTKHCPDCLKKAKYISDSSQVAEEK